MPFIDNFRTIFSISRIEIKSKHLDEFTSLMADNNLLRMYRVSWFTLIISLGLFVVDYLIISSDIGVNYPLYSSLLVVQHIVLLSFSLINILLYTKTKSRLGIGAKKFYQYAILQTFFILLAGFSIVGQLYHGSITLYLVGIFSVAAFFAFDFKRSLRLFLITHIIFLIGVILVQNDTKILLNNTVNGTIAMVLAFILNLILFRLKVKEFNNSKTIEEKNKELEISHNNLIIAKDKIEDLLGNILPEQIVAEFNERGFSKPANKENATIVFTDFVSFCKFAEQTDSEVVVQNLDTVFQRFDDIVRDKGLEKLKTIGDSYMFAGGLFTDSNQVESAVDASLEILDYVVNNKSEFAGNSDYQWHIRIGITTGPVVTGLIGKWRFIYDTWGNTVNLASRLEHSSESNRINISEAVYEQLKNNPKYLFENRGIFPIKNMSPVRMYFVSRSNTIN